jgi:hypothetical protein
MAACKFRARAEDGAASRNQVDCQYVDARACLQMCQPADQRVRFLTLEYTRTTYRWLDYRCLVDTADETAPRRREVLAAGVGVASRLTLRPDVRLSVNTDFSRPRRRCLVEDVMDSERASPSRTDSRAGAIADRTIPR